MNIINLCIELYFLLKQFYLTKSGTLQIADIFILIAFGLTILRSKKIEKDDTTTKMLKQYKYLLVFFIFVVIINTIGYLIYSTNDFLKSTLYYLFILMGIYVLIYRITDKRFLNNIYYIIIFNIILQFAIFILGKGRYYEHIRYMGTFNDPNQFGFFIIMMLMYMYILSDVIKKNKRIFLLVFIIGSYLIFESASTGMLLALISFIIIQFTCAINIILKYLKKYSKQLILGILLLLLIVSFILVVYNIDQDIKNKIDETIEKKIFNSFIFKRVQEKINKIGSSDSNLTDDRRLDIIIEYPQYLLIGAGQGNNYRFTDGQSGLEIHSTLPSLLFYYGAIPFMILMYWIYLNLKGLKLKQYSVYIAVLIESFTLLNQRQLLLWLLILLANNYRTNNIKEDITEKISYNKTNI